MFKYGFRTIGCNCRLFFFGECDFIIRWDKQQYFLSKCESMLIINYYLLCLTLLTSLSLNSATPCDCALR